MRIAKTQVTFDPSNPYRRKSSLVTAESPLPYMHAKARQDQCLVHQFLDSQRRPPHSGGIVPAERQAYRAHPIYATPELHVGGMDIPTRNGGAHPRRSNVTANALASSSRLFVEPSSLDGGHGGQADQQAWTSEMTKSMSQLDLTMQNDVLHSRMLTKRQLSDMAWGVRELSRRLSSMRIRFRVKNIFLLTKIYDQDLVPKTRELTRWLLDRSRDVDYVVYVQDKLKTNKRFDVPGLLDELAKSYASEGNVSEEDARASISRRLRYWDEPMCRSRPHTFDFVITMGGDGTVLFASWLFQRIVPPVLSFALGSLGFLTKFDFEDHRRILASAFEKGVTVSLRLRFESTVMRSIPRKSSESGKESEEDDLDAESRRDLIEELIGEEREDEHTHRPDGTFEILNEVVVDRGPNASKYTATCTATCTAKHH